MNVDLGSDIPDHPFFCEYGPSYELSVNPITIKNENTKEYLDEICDSVLKHINNISII